MQDQPTRVIQRPVSLVNYAIAVIILMCLSGCIIGAKYLDDEPIGKEKVVKIRSGQTPIMDIMTRLGPPETIARHGQNSAFLELFTSNRKLNEEEAVYYYHASRKVNSGFIVVLILINGGGLTHRIQAERLWMLVNERTGLIEDYVYRGAGDDEYVTPPASELGSR